MAEEVIQMIETKDFSKTVRIGVISIDNHKNVNIFCKVAYTDSRLSISGVIGPQLNGNAIGSCGQINMGFEHRNPEDNDKRNTYLIKPSEIIFANRWSAELWLKFLDNWSKYHCNDMKAGCEHQNIWPIKKELILIEMHLKSEIHQEQNRILEKTKQDLIETGKAKITKKQRILLKLPYSIIIPAIDGKNIIRSALYYIEHKRETKLAGWVYPSEHPEGLLCKPCDICGYKYGSKWNRIEVPEDILDFFRKLPDTDIQPAWV